MALEALGVGQPRKIFRRIGVQTRLERATRNVDHAFVRALLDRDLRVGQQPRELDQQPPGHHDRALAFDPCIE